MVRPLSISREELKHWADKYDAPAKLPVLVRRLLLATTPLSAITMRGDGGTRLGGWDGEVITRRETPFCPMGLSVWELSVEGNTKTKLDRDFDKRTAKPNLPAGVDSKRVTYVAVTARSFDKKKTWAREKKALGRWADVRVYDVDDLAMWLEQAPAVATWFGASELGRTTSGIRTVEDFLYEFSHAFTPPLPATVLLSGEDRTKQSRELLTGLVRMDEYLGNQPADNKMPLRTWKISAESADEALLFMLATLTSAGDEAASLRERTLIVENQEAFRACVRAQSQSPVLLLPTVPSAIPAKVVGYRVQAAHPVSWDEKVAPGEGIRLDLIPHYPLEAALKAAGFKDPGRWARDAEGRLSKLRILLMGAAYGQRTSNVSAEHIALLLVGAWTPTHEADREVLRRLGADPDKAERLCGSLSQGDDPMLEAEHDRHAGTFYRLVAPRAIWKEWGRDLTPSDLTRFFQVAQDVLIRTPEPADEGEWTQPQSPIERELGRLSSAAFEGVAASIAWLAIADEEGYLEPTHRRGTAASWATALVRNILAPDGRLWQWYSSILNVLAEAAPEQFLENLSDNLRKHPEAVEADSVELLWALETLAWDENSLRNVIMLLAELDTRDERKDKGSNSAFRSLGEILHYGLPQSKTTAVQRIQFFEQLFVRHESVAWRLAVSQLNGLGRDSFLTPSQRPQYRRWVDHDEKPVATYGDIRAQAEALLEMVIERAGMQPSRWAELVTLPHHTLGRRILDALKEKYPEIVDPDAVLWDAIRKDLSQLAWTNALNEKRNDSKLVRTEEQSRLLELYRAKIPTDLVLRYRWLFEYGERLPERVPGGDDENRERRNELIKQAIVELGDRPERWKLFERLATEVKAPRRLAAALAECAYVEDIEQALLEDPPKLNLGPCLDWFWAHRKKSKAGTWPDFLRDLVAHGRVNEVARILLRFQGSEETWDLVDTFGEPLRTTYWSQHEPDWFDRISQAAYERGIACLVEAGRTDAAVEACVTAIHYDLIGPLTVLRVLDAVRDADPSKELQSYDIEALFSELDKHPEVNEDQVIDLEIALAERFDFPHGSYETRGARCFYAKLNRSPEYFVDVVRRMQKPDAMDIMDELFERPKDAAALERKHLRSLMFDWRSYPGAELPVAQREMTLEKWCNEVFRLARNQENDVVHYLETMLARVDPAEDGHWPCLAARKLIESGTITPEGLRSASSYQPGLRPVDIGERNTPLRDLAEQYDRSANALATKYPVTAAMLRKMAAARRREADEVEAEEGRERIQWGERNERALDSAEPPVSGQIASPNVTPKKPAVEIAQAPETRAPQTEHRAGLHHIRHIHVENLRCFDSLTLDVDDEHIDKDRGQCLILLGANGTGKTTLLRAIAAALLDEQAAGGGIDQIPKSYLLLRDANKPGKIRLTLANGEEFGAEFVRQADALRVRELFPTPRPWVVGYGCFRGSLLGGNAHAMARAGNTATLWGEGMGLWPSLQTLQDIAKKSKSGEFESRVLAEGAKNALIKVLHDIEEVSVESERLVLGGKGVGGQHSAEALSDGYLGTMGWVLDMIFRWAERMRGHGEPISVDFLAKMEGVALIDDIDLHLHPKWQRKLVKNLQDTFPRMTFVGTTHNPQTILGVRKPNQIHVLRRSLDNSNQVDVLAMDVPVGRRAHEVLTGPWFDLDSTLDDETLDLMDQHQQLLLLPVRDQAKINELQEKINTRLSGFVETSREAYVYAIVTEILQERFPKLRPEEREKVRQELKDMVKARIAEKETQKP